MQKKIIALAVAGLMSGAAFAQSNVTVYGVVDAFFGQNKATAAAGSENKNTVVDDGVMAGSRLGFKGTEDLGGGLKALFTMEFGVDSEQSTGIATTARQQFVGLTGNWGTFVAGRLYSPGYNISNKFNTGIGAGRLSALQPLQNTYGGTLGASTINGGAAGRLDNALAYVSPSFSGLTATVAYTTLGESTAGKSDRVFGLGLDYDNGPVAVSFANHNIKGYTAATAAGTTVATWTAAGGACTTTTVVANVSTTTGLIQGCSSAAVAAAEWDQKENILAGSYNFGMVKIAGTYQNLKAKSNGVEQAKGNTYSLGAIVPMGAGSFNMQYARLNDKMAANDDAKSWMVGYQHALSKRTSVYTGYTQVKNKNAQNGAANLTPVTTAGTTNKSRNYGVGLNHSF